MPAVPPAMQASAWPHDTGYRTKAHCFPIPKQRAMRAFRPILGGSKSLEVPQLTVTIMPTFVNHPTICQSTAPRTSPMMMPRKSGRNRT